MPETRAREFRYGGQLKSWEWVHHLGALLETRERAMADPWEPYGLEWRRRAGALLEAAFAGTSYHLSWLNSPARAFDAPPPTAATRHAVEDAKALMQSDGQIVEGAHAYARDLGIGEGELTVPSPPPALKGDGWAAVSRSVEPGEGGRDRSADGAKAATESELAAAIYRRVAELEYPAIREIAVGPSMRHRADLAVDVPGFGRVLIEVRRSADRSAIAQVETLAALPGVAEALLVVPSGSQGPLDHSSAVILREDDLIPYLRGRSGLLSVGSKIPISPADLSPWRTFVTAAALFAIAIAAATAVLALLGLLQALWRPLAIVVAIAVFLAAAAGITVRLAPWLDSVSWKPLSLLRVLRSQLVITTIATAIGTVLATLFLTWITGSWNA